MSDLIRGLGFYGSPPMSLDAKGRLTIPASFVKELQSRYPEEPGNLWVTISPELCVEVRPYSVWERRSQEIDSLPQLDRDSRDLKHLWYAFSSPTPLDANNRLRLPQEHLKLCGIEKEVAVVGQRTHFEVWDRQKWLDYVNRTLPALGDVAHRASLRG